MARRPERTRGDTAHLSPARFPLLRRAAAPGHLVCPIPRLFSGSGSCKAVAGQAGVPQAQCAMRSAYALSAGGPWREGRVPDYGFGWPSRDRETLIRSAIRTLAGWPDQPHRVEPAAQLQAEQDRHDQPGSPVAGGRLVPRSRGAGLTASGRCSRSRLTRARTASPATTNLMRDSLSRRPQWTGWIRTRLRRILLPRCGRCTGDRTRITWTGACGSSTLRSAL